MAPLPPRPSWVTVTDPPEPPCGYGSPLAPWRPAGRKSLKQSQVFLNQVPAVPSRPSSAPSTTAASARPSSGRSWGSWSRPPSAPAEAAERPQSAPVRPRSAPRRLQPPSRPSSAWQRPSSAPAGPRGTNATNGALSVSWRGRRYRVRQTGLDRSQLSQTSLDSMANAMASFSIYTDHGLSDDEDHLPPAEKTEDAPPPEADAASTEMAVEAESEDSGTSTVTSADPGGSAAEAAKMWSGKATLGILQVSVAERPLYAELKMGGEAQCTSCVTGRWPSLAEKLTFELQDIRVQETLTLCFWTSVGEWRSRPRCVACGKTTLNFEEKERQVTVTLDVHQNGQLLRGLAVLHLEVAGRPVETDIFDHGDENCSRNLLLCRHFKGRRFRGIKERPVGPMDRVMDVNARCWSYLEQRSSFLKVRRQECHQRIRKAQALRAGPAANQGPPKLSRISSEQAFRLQRFLRSFVKCGQHGSRELAKVTADAFQASQLRFFLEESLQVPHLSEDDASALKSLLCEDGQVQMKTFLNFVEHGVTVVPPARVIYPDEQRARDILKEMFPGFLAKEQQREMELFEEPA